MNSEIPIATGVARRRAIAAARTVPKASAATPKVGLSRTLAYHSRVVRQFSALAARDGQARRIRKAATPARITRMRMPEPRATSAKITSPIRRLPRDGGTASVVSVVFMGCLRFEKGVRDVFVETMVVTRAHRM